MPELETIPTLAVVACDVLRDEVEQLALNQAHLAPRVYLPMGLHDRPELMRAELQRQLAAAEAVPGIEAVALVYGLCGMGTAGLGLSRVPLVLPRAHDCVTLFFGSRERYTEHRERHPGAYYYTPGWQRERRVPGPDRLALLEAEYRERFEDPEDVEYLLEVEREVWRKAGPATYLDHGLAGGAAHRAYAEGCARALGWDFEAVRGDPRLLRDLLAGAWDEERFLVVPPGGCIAPSHDARVVKTRLPEAGG
jgi:hypothetical protein